MSSYEMEARDLPAVLHVATHLLASFAQSNDDWLLAQQKATENGTTAHQEMCRKAISFAVTLLETYDEHDWA